MYPDCTKAFDPVWKLVVANTHAGKTRWTSIFIQPYQLCNGVGLLKANKQVLLQSEQPKSLLSEVKLLRSIIQSCASRIFFFFFLALYYLQSETSHSLSSGGNSLAKMQLPLQSEQSLPLANRPPITALCLNPEATLRQKTAWGTRG